MNNRVRIPGYLLDAITDIIKRDESGLPVSAGEKEWVRAELATVPGFTEWLARDLLNKALHCKKALAP